VDFIVKKGDKIAQLILEKNITPDVLVVDNLQETIRGSGGFGSTDKIQTDTTNAEKQNINCLSCGKNDGTLVPKVQLCDKCL
jgi:hypothetical protein